MDRDASPGVALTRALIRRPSVTPADAGALDVLQARLQDSRVQRPIACPFPKPARPTSTISTPASATARPSCCSPAIPMWCRPAMRRNGGVDPFTGEIVDGEIMGRGAADMKGGIAAFAAAAFARIARNGAPQRARSAF